MTKCYQCDKEFDEGKDAHGHCYTHDRMLCWKCANEWACPDREKSCKRFLFTNPAWTINLKSLNQKTPKTSNIDIPMKWRKENDTNKD